MNNRIALVTRILVVLQMLALCALIACSSQEEPEGPAEQIGKGIDQIRSGLDRLSTDEESDTARSNLTREERAKIAADKWEREVRQEEERRREEELRTRRPLGESPYRD